MRFSHFTPPGTPQEHWNLWIAGMLESGTVPPPTPMVQRALAALPSAPRKLWRVAQYGSGTGRDTRALAADPRIGLIIAYDMADMAQSVVADIGFVTLRGDTNRLIGVRTPFEQLQPAELPRTDLLYASAAFSYVPENHFERVTRQALGQVTVGGVACATFGADSMPGSYIHQPITGVPLGMLRGWLADGGFKGTVTGYGNYGMPLEPGAAPLFYEVLARRRSAQPLPVEGLVYKG